jgi:hypothetical protein
MTNDFPGYMKQKIQKSYSISEHSCLDFQINLNLSASLKSCFCVLKGNLKNGSTLHLMDRDSGEIYIAIVDPTVISQEYICLFSIIFESNVFVLKKMNKIFDNGILRDWIHGIQEYIPGRNTRKKNELKVGEKEELKQNNITIGVKKNTHLRVIPYDLASFKWKNVDMNTTSGMKDDLEFLKENELKIVENDTEQVSVTNLQGTFPFRYLFFYIFFDDIVKKNSAKKMEIVSVYDSDTFHEIFQLEIPIPETFKLDKSEKNEILAFVLKRDFNQQTWIIDHVDKKNTHVYDLSKYIIKPKSVKINVSKARNFKKKYETYVKIYENLATSETDSHDAESKHKSQVISSSDPVWDYTLDLPIPDKHCFTRIEVWKKRAIKKNKLLGFRTFSFKEFYDGLSSWYTMQKKDSTKICKGEFNIEFQYGL